MAELPNGAAFYRGHAISHGPSGFQVWKRKVGRRGNGQYSDQYRVPKGWERVVPSGHLPNHTAAASFIDWRIDQISKGDMTVEPTEKRVDPLDNMTDGLDTDMLDGVEALIDQNDAYDEHKRTAHPHADLMAEYALDAQETSTPWERWEVYLSGPGEWVPFLDRPTWTEHCKYRRKPRHLTINGVKIPEPLRTCPAEGTKVWAVTLVSEEGGAQLFDAQPYSKPFARLIERRLCHLNEDSAKAHAAALLSFKPE